MDEEQLSESVIFKSTTGKYGTHCNIFAVKDNDGMAALRKIFPDGKADYLNFCLFSTSGVHGLYNTIEESEKTFTGEYKDGIVAITFLIIHPRSIGLRYGNCIPKSLEDYVFLKNLRKSSHEIVSKIGLN